VVLTTLCDQISNKGEGTRRDELLEELAKGGAFIIQDDRNNEHFRRKILRHFIITPSEGRVQDGDRANRKNSDMIAVDKEERERLEQQLEQQEETISKLTKTVEELKRKAAEEKKVLMVRHREEIQAKEEEIDALQHRLARQDEELKKALGKVPQEELKKETSEEKNDDDRRSKQEHEWSPQPDALTEATPHVEQTPEGEDHVAPPGDFYTILRNGTERQTSGGTNIQNQEAGRKELQQQLTLEAGLKSEKDANTGQEKPTEKTYVDGQTNLNQQSDRPSGEVLAADHNEPQKATEKPMERTHVGGQTNSSQQSDRSSKPPASLEVLADHKEPQKPTGMQNQVAGPNESITARLELDNWVGQRNANVLNPTSAKEDAAFTRRENISEDGQHVPRVSPLPKGSRIDGEVTAARKAVIRTTSVEEAQSIKEESNQSQWKTETKWDVMDTVDDGSMGPSKQERQVSEFQTRLTQYSTKAELEMLQEKLTKEADAKSKEMATFNERLQKLEKEIFLKERREDAKMTQEIQNQRESSDAFDLIEHQDDVIIV